MNLKNFLELIEENEGVVTLDSLEKNNLEHLFYKSLLDTITAYPYDHIEPKLFVKLKDGYIMYENVSCYMYSREIEDKIDFFRFETKENKPYKFLSDIAFRNFMECEKKTLFEFVNKKYDNFVNHSETVLAFMDR